MGAPYLGEIKIISWNFAPKGWAFCNGQTLPISQNTALFSLLGTTYGGNGQSTFALPNLQGRMPLHIGQGFSLGETGGETTHLLSLPELTAHQHTPVGSTSSAPVASPSGALPGQSASSAYGPNTDTSLGSAAVVGTGGGQVHENMSPYLVLYFVIALQGIFPSPN